MTDNERTLTEALKSFLQTEPKLGLSGTKAEKDDYSDNNPMMRGFEHLHGQIDEMFAHKAAELTHYTGICSSFTKVHSYKYLNDSTFQEAMDKEMTAQGIPASERKKAIGFIPSIIKELAEEQGEWAEADFGFHPHLDEIIEVSQPKQYEGQ